MQLALQTHCICTSQPPASCRRTNEMVLWFRQKRVRNLARRIPLHELRKRVRTVVIDDDKNAFPIEILKKEGYQIDYWANVESLDTLERGDYDIIILDIAGVATQFTASEGLGILEHLKNVNPAQIVVAFSGQQFDIEKNRFFNLADDTLGKPAEALTCKEKLDFLIQNKLTPGALWGATADLMRTRNVPAKTIGRIEAELCNAINKGSNPDWDAIVSKAIGKSDQTVRFVALLAKIVHLFG